MMVSSEYMENRIPDLERENKELRKTLREVVMRQGLAFPETEEDLILFDEGMNMIDQQKHDLFLNISKLLRLGEID